MVYYDAREEDEEIDDLTEFETSPDEIDDIDDDLE